MSTTDITKRILQALADLPDHETLRTTFVRMILEALVADLEATDA